MCSLNNPVVAAARSLADVHHALANAVCDATPQQVAATVKQLKARGDTRALAFLQVVLARRETTQKAIRVYPMEISEETKRRLTTSVKTFPPGKAAEQARGDEW